MYNWFNDYFPTIFHTTSVWLTVALAAQRYIYVCYSVKAKHLCTVGNMAKVSGSHFTISAYVILFSFGVSTTRLVTHSKAQRHMRPNCALNRLLLPLMKRSRQPQHCWHARESALQDTETAWQQAGLIASSDAPNAHGIRRKLPKKELNTREHCPNLNPDLPSPLPSLEG